AADQWESEVRARRRAAAAEPDVRIVAWRRAAARGNAGAGVPGDRGAELTVAARAYRSTAQGCRRASGSRAAAGARGGGVALAGGCDPARPCAAVDRAGRPGAGAHRVRGAVPAAAGGAAGAAAA